MNRERLQNGLRAMGIPFDKTAVERFECFHRLLDEGNRQMDLTAVLEEDERVDRHDLDSVSPLAQNLLPENASVIDVGTGAGFPGVPLLILRPDLRMTFLDSQEKRMRFLDAALRELELAAHVIHARAEDAGRSVECREVFDVAVSRAVAGAAVLEELTLPFVRPGGKAIFWKGPGLATEMDGARRAAFLLGGKVGEILETPIPKRDDWKHVLLITDKISKTPVRYPRKAGTPGRKPLA